MPTDIHCTILQQMSLMQARTNRLIDVEAVAAGADLDPRTIRKLIAGEFSRIDGETVDKLCRFFGCDVGDLFTIHQPQTAKGAPEKHVIFE